MDTGINPGLADFAGRIDLTNSRDVTGGNRGLGDSDGHGTAVAAVIAGAKDGLEMHGVAFDATIVSLRADAPGTCASTDGCDFFDSAIAAGIDAATNAQVKVINLSLGGSAPGSIVLNAMQRAVNAGIVLVIAAGNDGRTSAGDNADPFGLIPSQRFPGQVIIAGSIGASDGANGTDLAALSDFSNKAGSGASNYLTALGYRNRTVNETGVGVLYSGTSFSTPTIVGAVALLAQAFPNLSAAQIVSILFSSADDLGTPGIDSIYGHGRLNLTRAFAPQGSTTLANSGIAVGSATSGDLPTAAGDAGGVTAKTLGAIILDGYSRAYSLNLASQLRRAAIDSPLRRNLSSSVRNTNVAAGPISVSLSVADQRSHPGGFNLATTAIGPEDAAKSKLVAASALARIDDKTAVAFGFSEGAKAMERKLSGVDPAAFLIARDVSGDPGFAAKREGSIAVRRDLGAVALTLSGENGRVWQEDPTTATGAAYRWTSASLDRHFGSTWLSAAISRLDEKHTLLGGRVGEAFGGGGGSSSLFLDLEVRRQLGAGLVASASARRGWTGFNGGRFESGAYAFDLSKWGIFDSNDRIGVRVSQPLRIERGGFALMLPTSYDYATATAGETLSRFSLSPSGREIDSELSYTRSFAGGWLGGNLFLRRHPGHIASATPDAGVAFRYSLGF
ncbi:MAG: S8 family peptidase [Sphingomicrobium sp.]